MSFYQLSWKGGAVHFTAATDDDANNIITSESLSDMDAARVIDALHRSDVILARKEPEGAPLDIGKWKQIKVWKCWNDWEIKNAGY